jgi:membrane protease YdiL (CAAX protease family)
VEYRLRNLDWMATGTIEELVFRGYAFRRSPERHPRLVILLTALCFSLLHLKHFTPAAPGFVLIIMFFTFTGGLALGIVRLVSGSLGWCILMHGLLDVADAFIPEANRVNQLKLTLAYHALALVPVVIVLLRHPRLRAG